MLYLALPANIKLGCKGTSTLANVSSGLYYKHLTIVNYDSSVINKGSFKLIYDARVVIYNCNWLIIQATDCQ